VAESGLLAVHRKEFELDPPWLSARGRWQRRCTLIVRIRGGSGHEGVGEAAPLPGYSPDTLEGAEHALRAISAAELQRLAAATAARELLEAVAALLPVELPAARFALEMALLDRLGRRQGRPLWALLQDLLPAPPAPASHVELCALLSSSEPAAAMAEARALFEQGLRHFKLKIGPRRLQPAQRELLASLRAVWGDQVALRLDANQSLNRAELGATFVELARFRPEFVEEPLADPQPEPLAALPCGWALDESLQHLDPLRLSVLSKLSGCSALVLKPTALGGFARCAELALRARALGKAVVVSHTLESSLGWLACVHLAVALGPSAAAGLWPSAERAAAPGLVAGRLLPPRAPGLGVEI
jgi:L-Ala-D/L-Glu epimerase